MGVLCCQLCDGFRQSLGWSTWNEWEEAKAIEPLEFHGRRHRGTTGAIKFEVCIQLSSEFLSLGKW
jgi:hypothetical protein